MPKDQTMVQSRLAFPEVKRRASARQEGKQKAAEVAEVATVQPKTTRAKDTATERLGTRSAAKPQQSAQEQQPKEPKRPTRSSTKTLVPPYVPTHTSSRPASSRATKSSGAQANTSPYKAAKRSNATGSKQAAHGPVRYFDCYEIHGDEYKVGDAVYVVATDDQDELPCDDEEDMCVVCSGTHKPHTILECERCLGGFHLGCLTPPLKSVPKGVWLCDDCVRGEQPAANRKLRTAYEKFLFSPADAPVLNLGLITGFVKNRVGDGEVEFMCRYFCRPDDTHLGRQSHNGSREVFLTSTEHYEPALSVFGPAVVCAAKDFDDQEGTDVFMCEYEYDQEWKRFRRRLYNRPRQGKAHASAAAAGSDGEAGFGSDSDSEFDAAAEEAVSDDEECVRDRTFKPIYAFWAEKGMLPGGFRGRAAAAPRRGGALNRKTATLTAGDEEEGGVCATGVLELVGGGTSSLPAPSTTSLLVTARKALATAAPPANLPCRDVEKVQLTSFLKSAIMEDGGSGPGVLYVCGVPGTGKTACITEVLSTLRPAAQSQGVQVVFLNALSLPSPTHVYCKLWEKLTGQHVGPGRALAALEALFSGQVQPNRQKRACMTVLVVDEIDVLITKDQSVLYNLFEWPVRAGARLAVIGISNTHDLDDRVLPRISSRLASSKLAFNAYSADQLTHILEQRLEAAGCTQLIKPAAVKWAVRKVASSSGDVRRALELLRRGLEVAEAERRRQAAPLIRSMSDPAAAHCVTEKHVQVAIAEMFSAPHMQFLRSCSRLEKLALVALLLEMRATSKAEATVQAIHARLQNHVALLVPDARCEVVVLCRVLFEMAAKRLLLTSATWQALKAHVALAVHKDDVCLAVREDKSLEALHGQLA